MYPNKMQKVFFSYNASLEQKRRVAPIKNTICLLHLSFPVPMPHPQLRELEKERIAELGTSVSKPQEVESDRRRRMASRAGDLLSSAQLEKPAGSVRRRREGKGDYGKTPSSENQSSPFLSDN